MLLTELGKEIDSIPLAKKALSPITLTELGMLIVGIVQP